MRLRHKVAGTGIAVLLLFGGAGSPVGAQELAQAVEEDDDGFDDWGLLGLLGLLGLAGLAGRNRDDTRRTAR